MILPSARSTDLAIASIAFCSGNLDVMIFELSIDPAPIMRITYGKIACPEWPCAPNSEPRRTWNVSRYMGTRIAARPTCATFPLIAIVFSISGMVLSGAPAASTDRSIPAPFVRSRMTSDGLTSSGSNT